MHQISKEGKGFYAGLATSFTYLGPHQFLDNKKRQEQIKLLQKEKLASKMSSWPDQFNRLMDFQKNDKVAAIELAKTYFH